MAKIKIDLSKVKAKNGKAIGALNWANIPPAEGFIVLTHGEERNDLCDEAVRDLVAIGYATLVPVKAVAPAEIRPKEPPAEKPKPKTTKKRLSRSKKK